MAVIFLLAAFGVARVLSQAAHSTGIFTYQGCATVDLSCFGHPMVFSDGRLTPEACQLACQGHQLAALFPDSCRCGDDANAVRPVDENKCDYACMGDATLGMCGSVCPDNDPATANVYTRVTAPSQGPPATASQVPPPPAETPCSSSEAGESPGSPPRITPVGPAPEAPTSLMSPPAVEPAPTGQPLPQYPPSEPPQQSPCPYQGNSCPDTPAPAQGSQSHPAPEPKTYAESTQPPQTSSPNAPGYSPECQSPEAAPYTDGDYPDGCKPPGGSDFSPAPSESTLWPIPGNTNRPDGDPPVPSRVPGSDSTHMIVPPFPSFGWLALVAVMVI